MLDRAGVTMSQRVSWPREFMASVVVFLVALPLCMGIAIASGVPTALGLVAGIIGGIIVGSLAGSPLQVSGPAAGLAVLIWEFIADYGLALLGVAVLAAGAIQIAAGFAGIGRWFRAVSPAVIQGMLAGIGVLIFASQFHVMVDDSPRATGLLNLVSIPVAVYKGVVPSEDTIHHLAALTGLGTIVSIVLWNRFRPKLLHVVPGPLVGVLVGTLLAFGLGWEINRVDIPESFAASLNFPTASSFRMLLEPGFLATVFALALIASAETLLCATAVDRMQPDGPRTDYDRELIAQGVGNMTSGALGALPITGVIVRSSANVEAGAKTRYSAVMHGFWLLGLILALPFVLETIPTASLAAILVYTGYRLANPMQLRTLAKVSLGELLVFVGTVVMIVATNLLTGVLSGLALALIKLLYTFSHMEIERAEKQDRIDVGLRGAATFIRLPQLASALETVPRGSEVHLHVGALAYIDHACMELIKEVAANHEAQGGKLIVEWDVLQERNAPMTRGTNSAIPM